MAQRLWPALSSRICLIAICVAFFVLRSSTAHAACGGHCYAFAYWEHSGLYGGQATIHPTCMKSNASSWVNNEIWIDFPGTPRWIETGLNATEGVKPKPRFFVAENDANSHYSVWFGTAEPTIGDHFNASIEKTPGSGPSDWSVKIQSLSDHNVVFSHDITDQSGTAGRVLTGVEALNDTTQDYASSQDLSWKDVAQWHLGWELSTHAQLSEDPGTSASWADPYEYVRYKTLDC